MGESAPPTHGVVHVSHHMYYLSDGDAWPEPPFTPSNGLIVTQPGSAAIFTGAGGGLVNVALDVRQERPPRVDVDTWDEVIEVSLHVPTGRLRVAAPMTDAPDLPILTPAGPGQYRLRVHARGRDTAPDVVALEAVEDYLIICWPADPAPETVHKQTDAYGAGLRQVAARPPTRGTEPAPQVDREANLRRAAARLGNDLPPRDRRLGG